VFPSPLSPLSPEDVGLSKKDTIELLESQMISRHLDLRSRILKKTNQSYYTIGSSGHEGNVVLGRVFQRSDTGFLHYRSGALMVERYRQIPESDAIMDIILSLVASKDDPVSAGRHKVFASLALNIPPQTSTIASHLPKAVGLALSIQKAKVLNIKSPLPYDSVVFCSFGDASTNHSTALGALNMAEWLTHNRVPLPIVFICEDNGWGISVKTPADWVETMYSNRSGIKYIQGNGLHLPNVYLKAQEAVDYARSHRRPVFLHLKMIRLMGHAGSDIEQNYRSLSDLKATESQDPLLHSSRIALESKYLTNDEILQMYEDIRLKVEMAADEAIQRDQLSGAQEVMSAIISTPRRSEPMSPPKEETRKEVFARQYQDLEQPRTLAQLLNTALIDLMIQYPNSVVFGEDVAKKGGVYHVTAGLLDRFGLHRVFNTLLDEQSILGTAIGLAHNGFLPVPEIQFLAYLHNAEDQLRGEAATLSFFSNSQFQNPMVIRIAGLAYQKGFGGHFHNDNSITVLRDIPGLIVVCPSNGLDAVRLLRSSFKLAHEDKRIIVFLEPIALYHVKDLHEDKDSLWMDIYPPLEDCIALGEVGVYGDSQEHVILTYGNGCFLSRQAEKVLLDEYQIKVKIIDLRWLCPLPMDAIIREIDNCKHLLIVDEGRKTGSISEEIITLLMECMEKLPRIRRITGQDSWIPLGTSWQYVLPSKEDIIKAVLEFK
ncbi:MAG TPA: MFS transporter, partial [Spirochaetes bacterium]|nr:MFS transporter [Spirochaetota bacterium]